MWEVRDYGNESTVDVISDAATWVRACPNGSMMNAGPSLEAGEIPDAAQGVIGRDGGTVYQIAGRGDAFSGAQVVSLRYVSDSEGTVILERLNGGDPEDTEPEVPEDVPAGVELMTRAQLTAKVIEQENEIRDLNEQIDLLLSGVTEDETGA